MEHQKCTENRPKWYVNPKRIRLTTYHSWTKPEMNRVYFLRMQGYSVKKIIKVMKLNVRKTQIYNIVRILKKNHQNKCFQCGHVLSSQELFEQKMKHFKKCFECKEKSNNYKKEMREGRLEGSLCGSCGKRPVAVKNGKAKTFCVFCLSYIHRQRILKGLCGTCGKNRINKMRSIALCNVCLDRNVRYARQRRKQKEK